MCRPYPVAYVLVDTTGRLVWCRSGLWPRDPFGVWHEPIPCWPSAEDARRVAALIFRSRGVSLRPYPVRLR